MTYSDKLKDPRWQRKRLEVFNRDGFACLGCGATHLTLQVHHKTYSGEPWDAKLSDLETLCGECHVLVEHHLFGLKNGPRQQPARILVPFFKLLGEYLDVMGDERNIMAAFSEGVQAAIDRKRRQSK